MQPERNPKENEGLRLIVRVNSQRRKMMNMQTSKGFVQSQNMMTLSGIFNKFIPEKYLQESILVENPVPLNLHSPRKMDEFMRDLIFEKRADNIEEAQQT